ncbi:MAG: glycosyltransferase family 2 protein [Gemmatimonadota bacterium]|nr:glycosyltransferase family 2 protein [Gemmatimonadota bacterium]
MLLALAVVTLLWAIASFADLVIGSRSIPLLAKQPVLDGAGPRVSIVIAARDEARQIEAALRSVLSQNYDDYEVILVDDRSTDDTGAILDRMAANDPRLRVLHVTELPAGWLGKNHALMRGAEAARSEFLLFSDADVVLHPTALSRAVRYMIDHRVDHIAVGPHVESPSALLALGVNYFALMFMLYLRPWRAHVPGTRWHAGIGAFNLVRATSYVAAGTLRRIALRPDDDLKLGKILKMSGASQHVLSGRDMVSVEWYRTLGEFVRGLRKNSFAGLDYSLLLAAGGIIVQIGFNVWPFMAILATTGPVRTLNIAIVLVLVAMSASCAYAMRSRPWLAILHPIAALIFAYTVTAAILRTLITGGIEWRDTRYSLDELRSNKI